MSELIEKMKCKTDFYAEKAAATSHINQAEKSLGLKFALDFKEYLRSVYQLVEVL